MKNECLKTLTLMTLVGILICWQLQPLNGRTQNGAGQTSDGEVIIVRNGGSMGLLAPAFEVRVDSKYEWLNKGLYLSSNPGIGAGGVGLTFYESRQ